MTPKNDLLNEKKSHSDSRKNKLLFSEGGLLWIPTLLCNHIFVNRRWQAGPMFQLPWLYTGWGLPSLPSWLRPLCQSSWSLAHTFFEGAQPRVWAGTSLCIWGTDEKTLPVLPLWSLCFCWVHVSPCSGLPPHVHSCLRMWSKTGRRREPSLSLPGDQVVWCRAESPEISAESWPSTEQRKTSPVPFYCCGCHGRPKQYTPASLSLLQLPNHLPQTSRVGRTRP